MPGSVQDPRSTMIRSRHRLGAATRGVSLVLPAHLTPAHRRAMCARARTDSHRHRRQRVTDRFCRRPQRLRRSSAHPQLHQPDPAGRGPCRTPRPPTAPARRRRHHPPSRQRQRQTSAPPSRQGTRRGDRDDPRVQRLQHEHQCRRIRAQHPPEHGAPAPRPRRADHRPGPTTFPGLADPHCIIELSRRIS
jgi:hypothetical protein